MTPELLELLTRTQINGPKENMVQTGCLELNDKNCVHWWVLKTMSPALSKGFPNS